MKPHATKGARIAERREAVAALRLRGATIREIQRKLSGLGIVNHDTGQPFSRGVVANDIKFLEKQWQDKAARHIDELKANQLAEIRAGRRKAWSDNNLPMVSKFMKQEMDLVGSEAAKRQELKTEGDITFAVAVRSDAD